VEVHVSPIESLPQRGDAPELLALHQLEGYPMATTQIIAANRGGRPWFIAAVLAATFVVSLATSLSLSRGIIGGTTTVPSVPAPFSDMSTAAYAATHPAAIAPATDMSTAAYAATHPAVVPTATAPANDISTLASSVAIAIATLAAVALLGLGAVELLKRPRTTS
jgi:hypothetical protein